MNGKLLSYKELKKMTEKGDVILKNVREVRFETSTADGATYVRARSLTGVVRVWRAIQYKGLWVTTDTTSFYFTRGHVLIEMGGNEND